MHTSKEGRFSKEKAYREIKRRIITRQFPPGTLLNERRLAAEFGVSRTPVREALHSLQEEGWIDVLPRKGAEVKPVTRLEIEEMIQLRNIMAPACVDIAIPKLGHTGLAYLRALISRQREAAQEGDEIRFTEIDREFHLSLVKLSGNRYLLNIAEDVGDHLQRMIMLTLTEPKRFTECIEEHGKIVDALEKSDAGAAKKAILDHLATMRELLLHHLAKRESAKEASQGEA